MDITELRNFLKAHGITQKALAERLGLSVTSIKNKLSGRRRILGEDIMEIMEACYEVDPEITFEELFKYDGPQPRTQRGGNNAEYAKRRREEARAARAAARARK